MKTKIETFPKNCKLTARKKMHNVLKLSAMAIILSFTLPIGSAIAQTDDNGNNSQSDPCYAAYLVCHAAAHNAYNTPTITFTRYTNTSGVDADGTMHGYQVTRPNPAYQNKQMLYDRISACMDQWDQCEANK